MAESVAGTPTRPHASTAPTTGRAVATPVSYRKRNLRPMSARQLEKYQRTIQRTTKQARDDHEPDGSATEHWIRRRPLNSDTTTTARPAAVRSRDAPPPPPPASFVDEQSFVRNPLTSRIVPPTPRAQASQPNKGKRPHRRAESPMRAALFPQAASPPSATAAPEPSAPSGSSTAATTTTSTRLSIPPDVETQDALLIQDLLSVLQGIEGEFITYAPGYDPASRADQLRGPEFVIDSSFDPSLRDLVQRILPLARYFVSINAFVELESDLDFGTVVHALCAAIRAVLKDYSILLAQLEHLYNTSPTFTLQKFWLYVHKTLRTFTLLHSFTSEVSTISHADILEPDEDDPDPDDEEEEGEDEDDAGSDLGDNAELERQRRELLGLDETPNDDGIIGGVVKGGEILSILWERMTKLSGDSSAYQLFLSLFAQASLPYRAILLRWISTGNLADPYEEFLILEDTSVTQASLAQAPTDEYWEQRYTLRDERLLAEREQLRQQGVDPDESHEPTPRGIFTGGAKVPAFLEPWKHKILLAGKYLNVLRECGTDLVSPLKAMAEVGSSSDGAEEQDDTVVPGLHDPHFCELIEQAYDRANERLLRLLLVDHDIVGRLKSVKHYFVLDQADFFLSFYEQGLNDLRKSVQGGRAGHAPLRLNQLLGMVLGSSTTVGWADPYKEDVQVECHTEKVYSYLIRVGETKGGLAKAKQQAAVAARSSEESLRVMDVFQFDVKTQFPVSLVLSKSSIVRWQDLQRVVVHLKILEHQLSQLWAEHNERHWTRRIKSFPALEQWKRRLFFIHHCMLFWVQSTLHYMTSEVIEPAWNEMLDRIDSAKTVDQLMRSHFWFVNTARKAMMLTDPEYVKRHARQTQVVEYLLSCSTHLRDQLFAEMTRTELNGEQLELDPKVDHFMNQLDTAWNKNARLYLQTLVGLATTDNTAATPLANKLQATKWF